MDRNAEEACCRQEKGQERCHRARQATGRHLAVWLLMEQSTRRHVPHKTRKDTLIRKLHSIEKKLETAAQKRQHLKRTEDKQHSEGNEGSEWMKYPQIGRARAEAPKRETAVCLGTMSNPVKSDYGIHFKSTYCG